MCSLYWSTNLLSSKYNHYCLSEHVKTVSKVSIFCRGTIDILHWKILLGMEFTRAAQVVAGILFHSSIMTSRSCWMLDTWCFSTFRLRTPHMCSIGFRSGDILGHSITFTFSSKAVVILAVYSGGYVGKKFLRGGHHLLLQNVSKCWNPCFPQLTTALQYQQLSCSPRPRCYDHHAWL